ncbi:MAG: XdhC family protein [Pseudonocardiales bacterium]|nr:XdhC family protein [Pseudonocardiales bacterium]MBV9731084.1 XdhC family protein [Pseudonocardiales bacterium]
MREVLDELVAQWRQGKSTAVGTVVSTYRSAPRPAGASMLVTSDERAVGSVSGGCVEGAVFELGQQVLADDTPVLQRYGVSDDDAFTVGLTCGGIIDVFVEKVDPVSFPELDEVAASVAEKEPVAMVTVVAHPDAGRVGLRMVVWPDRHSGTMGSSRADEAILEDARGALAAGRTVTLHYGPDGQRRGEGMDVFVNSMQPPPRMLVFGAIDFAAAMARMGVFLGYYVTVCDARPVFATRSRFPDAHEVVVNWPHRYLKAEAEAGRIDQRTVVTVLTHDPKFDVPVLVEALRLDLAYVGAMGSRRTHKDREIRLREAGVTDEELSKIASPIGLDLGARTPEETAVSIAAELISLRWGGSAARLADAEGPIHGAHPIAQPEPVDA